MQMGFFVPLSKKIADLLHVVGVGSAPRYQTRHRFQGLGYTSSLQPFIYVLCIQYIDVFGYQKRVIFLLWKCS